MRQARPLTSVLWCKGLAMIPVGSPSSSSPLGGPAPMPAKLLLPPGTGPTPAELGSFPLTTVIPSQAEQITLVDGEAVASYLCLQALSVFCHFHPTCTLQADE